MYMYMYSRVPIQHVSIAIPLYYMQYMQYMYMYKYIHGNHGNQGNQSNHGNHGNHVHLHNNDLIFFLSQFIFCTSNIQEWFDFSKQSPPSPITKEQMFTNIPLYNSNG